MILAIILFFSNLSSTGRVHVWTVGGVSPLGQSTQNSTDANSPSGAPVKPESQQSAPATPAPKSGEHAPTAKKISKGTHTKKVVPADCAAAPAAAPGGGVSTGPSSSSAGTSPAPQTAPTNCPPKKTIVRQGGTSEPSIQLEVGIVGEQAGQQKDSTNQMLGATEQNLKKLQGRPLSPNQQNMVGQARQFVDEARKAITAGDLDRARTLAWKAQVLSEDLVKPED